MKTHKIRELVQKFKDLCRTYGWGISKKDDWIKTKSGYHNFIWTRSIHPSSFERVTSKGKCVVRDGLSYRVVEATCTAWLFCKAPSEDLLDMVCENPEFSRRTAIYNLGPILKGKSVGFKLNNTDSPVFEKFERFLRETLKVELHPFLESTMGTGERVVANLA